MALRRVVEPSHFFKVILTSTLEDKKLRIPEKFVRIFGDTLSVVVTLTVPNGQVWRVGLTRDGSKIWFHDGWYDFVQYHSISVGYFLVFKYVKNSNFHVLIFDVTACEIQYPYSSEGIENDKQNPLHQEEMENGDSDEVMVITPPNPPFKSMKNKVFGKCPMSSSRVTVPLSQPNWAKSSFVSAMGVDENQESAAFIGNPKFKRNESHNKRCKMEESVEKNESNAVGTHIKLKKTAYKVEMHSLGEANKRIKFDEDELMALLEDMRICVSKRFKNITTQEREKAIHAARLFKPKNPSFMVLMRSLDISLRRLYVPAEFAHIHFSRNAKSIEVLDSEGRKWSFELTWMPLCFITKLGGFAKKLDDGDICVFELIKGRRLKVSVLKH